MGAARDLLLRNSGRFQKGVMLNGYKLIIRGSCPFDSLVSVLVTSAIDIPEYLEHIEKSENNTFGFILVLIEYGANPSVKHVYIQHGSILQNFIPDTESNKFELAMFSDKNQSMPCKVTDFPVDVSLLNKNFRFVKLFITRRKIDNKPQYLDISR